MGRKDKARGGNFILGLMCAGFSLVFMSLAIIDAVEDQMTYNLLIREGTPATAVITEKYYRKTNRVGRPDRKRYYMVYQYAAMVNGLPADFENKESLSRSHYVEYQVGQKVEILYAASNPQVAAVKANLAPPSIPGVLLLLTVGGGFAYYGLNEVARSLGARRDS